MAARDRQRWLNIARTAAENHLRIHGLHALAYAGAEDLPQFIETALTKMDSMHAVIEIIEDDPRWQTQVKRVFEKAITDNSYTYNRIPAARYLAKHGYPADELIRGLLAKPRQLGSAIELALDYAPEHLGRLLRRGLRSHSSENRLHAAAILAVVDNEWSRRQLLAVLEGSTDHDATIEARFALRESREAAAYQAVDLWENEHPDTKGEYDTMARKKYAPEGGCELVLQRMMGASHDQVAKIRHRLPQEHNGYS